MQRDSNPVSEKPLNGDEPCWTALTGYGWWLAAVMALLYAYPLMAEYMAPVRTEAHPAMGGDFINLWTAAHLVRDGHIMVLFELDKFQDIQEARFGPLSSIYNWGYPPFLLPFLQWLAYLPFGIALLAWLGLTFAGYAAAIASGKPSRFMLIATLALAPSSFLTVVHGQNSFLTGALFVGGLRLLEKHPKLSGALFGLLTFKPHLGVLVPVAVLARRRLTTTGAIAIVTSIALIGGSLLLYGFAPWHRYFAVIYPYQRELLESCAAETCGSLWPTGFTAARLLGVPLNAAYGIAICLAGIAAICIALAWRRPAAGFSIAIGLTATAVASPYLNHYDLTLTSAAIALLLTDVPRRALSPLLLGLMGWVWLLPLFVVITNTAHAPVAPVLLLAFLLEQVRCMRRVQTGELSVPK